MNELLWIITFAIDFSLLLAMYKFMGKVGLFAWIPLATILANIQVLKTVEILGMTATLGNVAYASIFLATDILSENYGKSSAKLAVILGFICMIATSVIMNLTMRFIPAQGDLAHESISKIFSVMPRVALASLIAYMISQMHDVYSYHYWKKLKPGMTNLWIRNNLSTIVSQFLDSLVFTTIAFYGLYPTGTFISILLSTYLLKAIAAILDTPFMYLAATMHAKGNVHES